jgi:hypothetical protein
MPMPAIDCGIVNLIEYPLLIDTLVLPQIAARAEKASQ